MNDECIQNFDLAVIMPTPMVHFYWYLENCIDDYHEAFFIFGLHADIRSYMRMVEERDVYET